MNISERFLVSVVDETALEQEAVTVETLPKRRTTRYWRNLLVMAAIGLVPVYSAVAMVKAAVDTELWMHPQRIDLCCSPAEAGLDYEDVEFATDDGLTLRGWYVPSQNEAAIIVMHGMNTNREYVFPVVRMLAGYGYGVLAFDARAHGESDGDMLASVWQDGLAAVAYLKGRDDVDEARIGAWGFSLGGLMAIQSAALTQDIRAVVADGPGPAAFEDLPAPQSLMDWLNVPYDLAFFPALQARTGGFALTSTKAAIARTAPRPVLLIAAASERRMVEGFFEAAGEPKSLWVIPGIMHGQGSVERSDEYERRMAAFFDAALLG